MTAVAPSILVRESSGQHDGNNAALQVAAAGWLTDGTDLLIHTETTDAALRAIIAAGWDRRAMFRTTLPNGRGGEILIAWNPKVLRRHGPGSNLRLSDRQFKVGSITRDGVTAARQILDVIGSDQEVVVYGVHWPSGIFNFIIRMLASRETSRRLGSHIATGIKAHPRRARIVAGDTNENHLRVMVRRYYERTLHLDDLWSLFKTTAGSHGKRLIDAMFLRGFRVEDAGVDPKTAASDHRSIWARLRLTP